MKRLVKLFTIMFFIMLLIDSIVYSQGKSYTIRNIETINGKTYWTGFKQSHYGFIPPSTAYRGQEVTFSFPYKYIDTDGKLKDGTSSGTNTSLGYGAFSFDYSNHIVGLLYYINKKLPNSYNYYSNKIIEKENPDDPYGDNPIIYETLKMKEACELVAKEIMLSGYSKRYRDEVFLGFWTGSFRSEYKDLLLQLENEYFLRAYGKNAIDYLDGDFHIKASLAGDYDYAIRGAIWSIMEERYRRKKLAGKKELELKVAAGEVFPFLLYINCDYEDLPDGSRYYSNITFEHKKVDEEGNVSYDIDTNIDIDQVIDGAYQYMVYYYGKENSNVKSYKTALSDIDNESDYDYDSMTDFVDEYVELTGRAFPVLRGKELESFLTKIEEKKGIFKKSKANKYGSFGEDEEYTIESDINFSKAIRDMSDAMYEFCKDENGNIDKKLWAGLSDESVARTYLMAKNIIDSERVRDEYSYYDIGTNIIEKTCGSDSNIYLLIDFQKVKLDRPLIVPGEGVTHEDTDNDGIYDGAELSTTKDIDITGFIRKTLYAELYGVEQKGISDSEKWERKRTIDDMMAQYKRNVKEEFKNARCNNEYEHEFYYDESTDKLMVSCWQYKSNPVLRDTDFDGIDDGKGEEALRRLERTYGEGHVPYVEMRNDENPKSNHFIGKMHSTMISGDDGIEVDMTMDYRYFLMSNKNYYDELSTMSLLYANSIYRNNSGIEINDVHNTNEDNNLKIKDLMNFFGFKDIKTYYLGSLSEEASDGADFGRDYKDTHKTKVAIGYKNIEYHGIDKTVVGIVIRGTAEDDDWDSDFDMGDVRIKELIDLKGKNYDDMNNDLQALGYDTQYRNELNHFIDGYDNWTHKYHHAGFDISANRVMEILEEYMDENHDMQGDICFWVTGHSMGAGVANIVAAELLHGHSGINNRTDNVYCYTFASPNTFYLTDNVYTTDSVVHPGKKIQDTYREPHGAKYRCIFNVVNDDDFVPKLPMEDCGWTRYGRTAKLSVNNIKNKIPSNFSPIYDPYGSYYKLWLKYSYKSNSFAVNNVIYMLNGVYDDNRHMRDETYSYDSKLTFSGGINYSQNELNKLNEEIRYIDIKKLDDFVFDYSRPYQKNEKDILGYIQTQTPAYLMQSIAGAMHTMINDNGEIKKQGEDNTFLGSKVKDNQYRFIKTKMAHSGLGAKWSVLLSGGPLNALETPHYLESYYSLTKEINTTDFR